LGEAYNSLAAGAAGICRVDSLCQLTAAQRLAPAPEGCIQPAHEPCSSGDRRV